MENIEYLQGRGWAEVAPATSFYSAGGPLTRPNGKPLKRPGKPARLQTIPSIVKLNLEGQDVFCTVPQALKMQRSLDRPRV